MKIEFLSYGDFLSFPFREQNASLGTATAAEIAAEAAQVVAATIAATIKQEKDAVPPESADV